jgi:N4-(beta-N-acetylglucosaminyl)-L-asparaginase
MANRRKFIKTAALGSAALALSSFKTKIVVVSESSLNKAKKPIVLSTWNFGLQANEAAWEI